LFVFLAEYTYYFYFIIVYRAAWNASAD